MFKGFSDSSRNKEFHGFPNLNFQMNNEAFGFSGVTFDLDPAYGLITQTDLAAVSTWRDKIRGFNYVQATAGNQPRLVLSSATFNNNPVIDFFAQNRFLESTHGPTFSDKDTFAFVYQKLSDNTGAAPNQTKLFTSTSGVNSGLGFMLKSSLSNSVGWFNNITADYTSTTPYDTNPHIIVISKNAYIDNGTSLTPSGSFTTSDMLTVLSGSVLRSSGTFLLARIIKYENNNLSVQEATQLCTNINQKYAIY
jgi:hypothetical protein